jgi:hypothetical protein
MHQKAKQKDLKRFKFMFEIKNFKVDIIKFLIKLIIKNIFKKQIHIRYGKLRRLCWSSKNLSSRKIILKLSNQKQVK